MNKLRQAKINPRNHHRGRNQKGGALLNVIQNHARLNPRPITISGQGFRKTT